jgi:ABC-type transporter lipoprotein component MlaA
MHDRTGRFQRAVAAAGAALMVWGLAGATTHAEVPGSRESAPAGVAVNEARAAPDGLEVGEIGAVDEHDPWEGFNDRMLTVNRGIDRYALQGLQSP